MHKYYLGSATYQIAVNRIPIFWVHYAHFTSSFVLRPKVDCLFHVNQRATFTLDTSVGNGDNHSYAL